MSDTRRKCEGCEQGRHHECGLQTWCECECDPDECECEGCLFGENTDAGEAIDEE